jgi:hypothetical protein
MNAAERSPLFIVRFVGVEFPTVQFWDNVESVPNT